MNSTKSTTAARPRKSAAIACSARRPPAAPRNSRVLPRNAWRSTISRAGGFPIWRTPANSATTSCATASEGGATDMNVHAPFDTELFRKTMGGFATGVTVITVDAAGGPHGMTANAFMSGSLTPPLCVVSIAKRAHTHAMLVAAGRFSVNVLGEDQRDLAIYFAGKKSLETDDARFETIEGTPLLR